MDLPKDLLDGVKTILVIDWPSKEVPEALALAGFAVVVRGGPGPNDYSAYEIQGGEVVKRPIGRAPDHADLVYSYRPLSELPEIIAMAKALHAQMIWTQSGVTSEGKRDPRGCWLAEDELKKTREFVRSAGLNHLSEPYIAEYVREFHIAK